MAVSVRDVLLVVLFVYWAAAAQEDGPDRRPVAQFQDGRRQYRVLTLPNRLRCVLLSDPDTDQVRLC
jgi:hypothetical protein